VRSILGSAAALMLLVARVAAAPSPDAREILTKVSETYANLKSYDFNIEAHAVFEFQGVKYQFTMPQEMAQGITPDESLGILQKLFRITRVDNGQPANPQISFSAPNPSLYYFARIAQNLQYAKFLREETLEHNGKGVACYVIEILKMPDPDASPRAPAPSPQTVWIDETTYLVLRFVVRTTFPASATQAALQMDWDVQFVSYTLNGAPPQWIVDRKSNYDKQMAALSAKMVGTAAPDFVLRDLDGREVSLAGLRDKVVLLDFWATWCAPCRAELPIVASLEKAWSAKGLVVLRITDEPPEDVQAFLKRNRQSLATLVNGESVTKQFSVPGIPTLVVIDKGGKIVAYDANVLSESDLTTRLRKAGLD
jgi:thiol-disulfide isomerase/thioredoxin/outer membrane lipoprotein-sorting protein